MPRLRSKKAQRRHWAALELDETWTFVGRKKRKAWLWRAVARTSRRVVAWVPGSRGTATLARFWRALPRRHRRHTHYFTDAWRACPQVLPAAARCIGKTGTRVVEALNGKLRHRFGVLVRRSRSFSKCQTSHYSCIKIAIDQHNSEITLGCVDS